MNPSRNPERLKAFLRRWYFPCTALVLLYLLYFVIYWAAVAGRGVVTSLATLEIRQPDGSYEMSSLVVWECVVCFLTCVLAPSFREKWSPEGRILPKAPRWRRRALVIGYAVRWLALAGLVVWTLAAPRPYGPAYYFAPRIFVCCYYLYLCAVTNYPFGRRAVREDDG